MTPPTPIDERAGLATDAIRARPLDPVPADVAAGLRLVPDPALWVDGSGVVAAANDLASGMFGGSVTGRRAVDLVRLPDAAAAWSGPGEGRRLNGVPFSLEASARPFSTGHVVTLREPRADDLGRLAEMHFDAAFGGAPIGMALFDPDGRYIRVNDALCTMLGRTEDELLGRRDQDLTHPDDRAADVVAAWQILDGERSTHQCEKRFVRADGSLVWVIANLSFLRDGLDRPISWLGQFQDITDRRKIEERLQTMADRDPLTGLLNRRALSAALHAHVEEGTTRTGGLLVLDLDGFKAINDAFGHPVGDEVLVACADAVRSAVGPRDVVARLGGDEFAVFAPVAGAGDLAALALALEHAIDEVGQGSGLGVSIGVASVAESDGCPVRLMTEADRRMYATKAAAR